MVLRTRGAQTGPMLRGVELAAGILPRPIRRRGRPDGSCARRKKAEPKEADFFGAVKNCIYAGHTEAYKGATRGWRND